MLRKARRQTLVDGNPDSQIKIVVLLPCYNEESAIRQVVTEFQGAIPEARIVVYDNNSTDRTANVASEAGATVYAESQRGKGNVVRRMFSDVEADLYILCDGDGTYDASVAPCLIRELTERGLDMVNSSRIATSEASFRPGHRVGNAMLSWVVHHLFGYGCKDVLSGYRVFSRRFVKSFPAMSRGFEIETELTVHALSLRMPIGEIPSSYRERACGTSSKLRTWRDGALVLLTIMNLYKLERPLRCLSVVAIFFAASAYLVKSPDWTLLLAFSAITALGLGVVLDTISESRRESRRLMYLSMAGAGNHYARSIDVLGSDDESSPCPASENDSAPRIDV